MPNSGGSNSDGDITLGEVARNLEALSKVMTRGFERVDERFNTLAMVHADVYVADRAADSERHRALLGRLTTAEAAVKQMQDSQIVAKALQAEKDIADLRSSYQWVWRTIAGVFITIAVGAVLAYSTGVHP